MLLTLARLFGKIKAICFDKKNSCTESAVALEYSHKYTFKFMPRIQANEEYDLAISFLTPHYIVANKVQAKKKIAWIHTDYSRVAVDISSEERMWGAYDNIISISDAVTDSFVRVFPSLKKKIVLIENILPEQLIRRQAEKFDATEEMPERNVRLLSNGRFCYQKNFDSLPTLCKLILKKGIKVRWYIIGFGPDEELIRKKIEENQMQNFVIILGKREYPYPYIKECDIYIQPSRYEGKSVTVREAQMLGKPVIITSYTTAISQLKAGVDGIIVPIDNQECADGIATLIRNKEKMEDLIRNCKERDYSNYSEINKIYKMIEKS